MSSAVLDLDLARLSLAGSPYSHGHAEQQQQSQQQSHVRSASSLERSSAASPDSTSLQPHQVMQPPLHHGPPPQVRLKEPQRRRGIVKFFNSLKGFGFVVDNDPTALGGQEVFCHFSAISGKGGFRSLAEGEEVEYELVQGPKGFQAANLTGPGGRSVVGDPKARMQKPPAYLPLAPFAAIGPMVGNPYLAAADPYHPAHAHNAGMYPGSPYTQHVVYVPAAAAASMQPAQYAYTPVPLVGGRGGGGGGPGMPPPPGAMRAPFGAGMLPPSGGLHQAGPTAAAAAAAGSPSPFTAPQYQSYAAAPHSLTATTATATNGAAAAADRYSAASPLGRVGQQQQQQQQPFGGGGSPQQQPTSDYHQRSASATASINGGGGGGGSLAAYPGAGAGFGAAAALLGGGGGVGGASQSLSASNSPNPAAFSPPGGHFIGLAGTTNGNDIVGNGAGGGGGMPAFGGFAPFSPPTFNHAPLYPASAPGQQQHSQPYSQHQQQQYPVSQYQHQHHHNGTLPGPPSSTTTTAAAASAGAGTPAPSALFGSSGTPAPIGSRSGTPAAGAGGRSTPALGNGSLGNDAWKAPTATATTTAAPPAAGSTAGSL